MSSSGNRRFAIDRRALLAGGGLLAASVALGACDNAQVPVDEEGRVRLRLAVETPANAEHGGFHQAIASGAYEKRGLNVQIIQGAPGGDLAGKLAAGSVELALAADSFTPMRLVAQGAPVKAVAAFFQKSPLVLMTRPDAALTGIADLADRPVFLPDAARETVWPWLRHAYGFTDDQLQPWSDDPAAFLADRQAVRLGDLTRDPYQIRREGGAEPRSFLLADEAYPAYGALVLAPTAFARDNAEALRKFIAASVEGWRDYIQGDGRDADALIRRANPEMRQPDLDQARALLRARGLVDGGDAALYGLGAMTDERWKTFLDAMAEAGVYPANLDWRQAFTTQYLPGRG